MTTLNSTRCRTKSQVTMISTTFKLIQIPTNTNNIVKIFPIHMADAYSNQTF